MAAEPALGMPPLLEAPEEAAARLLVVEVVAVARAMVAVAAAASHMAAAVVDLGTTRVLMEAVVLAVAVDRMGRPVVVLAD